MFFKLNKLNKLKKDGSGSATIEATVSLTAFIFFVVVILSIINYCRLQALMSNAIDCTVKEMSQYSYLYKASGLKKYKTALDDASRNKKNDINDILNTTKVLLTMTNDTVDEAEKLAGKVKGATDIDDVREIGGILANIDKNTSDIKSTADTLADGIGDIIENPMTFMAGIATIAASKGIDLITSRLIAAPLAKSMSIKHFGETKEIADQNLISLGVKDGVNGLNFGMSTLFASEKPEDVCIVVYYKLKIITLLDIPVFEITLCKRAVTRAWLGGDDY